MFKLEPYLAQQIQRIERALDTRLPAETAWPGALHQAMRYSVFAGGKRLRPILCLAAAEALQHDSTPALIPALALEVLHTYTLIHDDLPSMDNDDRRRGKPTLHKLVGEANAILAGDALLTLAFEWLAGSQAPAPYAPGQLSLELARAAGSQGVVGGQVEDLAAEGQPPDADRLNIIHRHKTAALIRAAVRMGGIAVGATTKQLQALTSYGDNLGLAFQIADDILNETSSAAALGKAAGSDRQRQKMTAVAVYGLAGARQQAQRLTQEARTAVRGIAGQTGPLPALAELTIQRTY